MKRSIMVYYIYKMIHVPTGRAYIGQRKLFKRTPETDGYTGSGKISEARKRELTGKEGI